MDHILRLAVALAANPSPTLAPDVLGASTGASTLLLAVASGAVGAALLGLLGAWLVRLDDHRKWIRQERLHAYLRMLTIINGIFTAVVDARSDIAAGRPPTFDVKEMTKELPVAYAAIDILGPTAVADLAHKLAMASLADGINVPAEGHEERRKAAERAFTDATRKVLKIRNNKVVKTESK